MIRLAGLFVLVVAVVTWALFASSILDAVGNGDRASVLGTVEATATTEATTPPPSPTSFEATPTVAAGATATATATAGEQRYTIAPGDNLTRIADRFGVTVEALQEANAISDPASLRVGQEIVIPAPAGD